MNTYYITIKGFSENIVIKGSLWEPTDRSKMINAETPSEALTRFLDIIELDILDGGQTSLEIRRLTADEKTRLAP